MSKAFAPLSSTAEPRAINIFVAHSKVAKFGVFSLFCLSARMYV